VSGQSELPVTVLNPAGNGPLTGAADLETGLSHACVRLTNEEVRCWGDNSGGQLGDGTNSTRSRPAPVKGAGGGATRLDGVRSLGLGTYHSCARLENGRARCWGYNNVGQLGNNNTIQNELPVPVQNRTGTGQLTGVRQIDAGQSHTCASVTGGGVLCWGGDTFAQLGNGSLGDAFLPAPVRNPADTGSVGSVAQLDVEATHSCARLTTGQVRCWGRDVFGQLGAGPPMAPDASVAVRTVSGPGNLSGVAAVSAGTAGSCAVLATGQARCWGYPLGNGTADAANRPVVVG
jgi:alpha-tubulin suppressor-like RCC1 family protein